VLNVPSEVGYPAAGCRVITHPLAMGCDL